jgi:hypothetical protein
MVPAATYALPMPSTVADIFGAAGAEPAGVVSWREPPGPPEPAAAVATGIYVVALTDRLDRLEGTRAEAPISTAAVDELLTVRRKELSLDEVLRPKREQLAARRAALWLPDEGVVYIGLAGARKRRPLQGELAKRVSDYYATPLGASGPHAGGWPLKTLACLDELYVHYAYCGAVNAAEDACIRRFAEQVSPETRAALRDPVRVMPFANLEFPKGNPKNHGIRGARAPKALGGLRRGASGVEVLHEQVARLASDPDDLAEVRRVGEDMDAVAAPWPNDEAVAAHRSQNVTASDIAVGQVRIPIGPTKSILPPTRQDVSVVLRGRELTCRWDPRNSDKERSGVIRVGKAAAAELLSAGDVLAVSVSDGDVRLD